MSVINKDVLDYDGLQVYDSFIKATIPEFDGTTITQNENGKWQAKSGTSVEVDVENERITVNQLWSSPAVAGEVLSF